ncbi:PAP2 superfamily C-terminal [Mucilaginibacter mallensis]|uniref:PAP2 superfamily C-terminal n=1 Tax=Mucilaginibacter mallensis TaxID=652787 RepID=A0A1H1TMV9_MUCMA|nr:phosphatase PAP2-related protein [Mucilaginibacter mallensis]SDS60889.1 PAP2 superfamily C-terminal [Mucilaginibacter mallensis]
MPQIGLSIKDRWKLACNTGPKRLRLISGSIIIFAIIIYLPYFFRGIEQRQGVVLHDWLLAQVPPHNVSVAIFIIIWGTGLLILYRALYKPSIYLVYVWSLIFVCIARMISISVVALNPPIGLIPLSDPLTGVFYGHAIITKDLFFSGHITTVMLTFLCLEKKNDKIIAFFSIIAIAILLIIQHIHYTIDILAAPVITYTVYRFTLYLLF